MLRWRVVLTCLFVVLMTAQLLYPYDRVLPRTRLGEMPVGMKSRVDIKAELVKRQKNIMVDFNSKPTPIDPIKAGIRLDVDKTLAAVPGLRWYKRAVPMWPVVRSLQTHTVQPVVVRDDAKLAQFAVTFAA